MAKRVRMSGGFANVRVMRFLHTSDWHLGRSLHRADLREAQAAFLDHLVETVRSERVDAVLVAGDMYDRAIPSLDAVALYEDALPGCRAAGARVVLISGNHDSARRLGVNGALIDAAGVHLRTRPAALADPVAARRRARPGRRLRHPVPGAALGPRPAARGGPGSRDAEPRRRPRRRRRPDPCGRRGARGARTVVLAHAWVAGGRCDAERADSARRQASTSERDISVGGIGYVPGALFDGFGYVALGHLHGRRRSRTTCATRLAAAVLVLREGPPQGQLAGRGRRRRATQRRAGARPGLPAARRAPRAPR